MITPRSWSDARQLWDHHLMHHTPRPCSVIVGLGSHDPGVADVAVGLYLHGLAPVIVFTGSTSPTTRERMPRGEAVHYRERWCLASGAASLRLTTARAGWRSRG
ncbi:hypothetical protein YW5DRAFT_05670 [Streptomyces sp. Ncost-T6T-1]|nr:hypothetical protein YW5DRAFT_05670 [Streptomyces sp. Ncost-T6T-1]